MDTVDGSLAAHYKYVPFGNLLVATGPEANNNVFRFSTTYFDVETGLYYYGFRYYDPALGRWRTRDPIEEAGGINLYVFVNNQPIENYDLHGLSGLAAYLILLGGAFVKGAEGAIFYPEILVAIFGEEEVMKMTGERLKEVGGPFSFQLWDHAVNEAKRGKWTGKAVTIDPSNQHEWSHAVDMVKNSPEFQTKSTFTKQRLHEGTSSSGFIHIEFVQNSDLYFSIKGAQLHYEYLERECILKFTIAETYNFEKISTGKYFQDRGKIATFPVRIHLPEKEFSAK